MAKSSSKQQKSGKGGSEKLSSIKAAVLPVALEDSGISIESPESGEVPICPPGNLTDIDLTPAGGTVSRFWAKAYPGPCPAPDENPWEAGASSFSGSGTGSFDLPANEGQFCLKVWAIFDGEDILREDERDYIGREPEEGECLDGGGA